MPRDIIVDSALGKIPFDLAINHARLANVFAGEIHDASIGITGGKVAYVADSFVELEAERHIDAGGRIVAPGLIDAHMHLESAMVAPGAFAAAVLPHGTTTVAADPHEMANVLGAEGVRIMMRASTGLPLSVFFLVPSTVPSAPGFETGGAEILAGEVRSLLSEPGVIGLAEVMDFWAVIDGDPKIAAIIEAARSRGAYIEGHCPVFSGRQLQAYIAAGIGADHTIMTVERVRERLRAGMTVQIQERFITRELMSYVNSLPDASEVLIVTDDVSAEKLRNRGHLDHNVRKAIEAGLDPMRALQSTTIKAARCLRLHDRGVVAPGKRADLLIVDSLEDFKVDVVIAGGEIVARAGRLEVDIPAFDFPDSVFHSVKLEKVCAEDFIVPSSFPGPGRASVRIVTANGETSYTSARTAELRCENGRLIPAAGMLTMAVLERHGRGGGGFPRFKPCFIEGLGDFRGAAASTFSHDCHNLVVIGSDAADMAVAANALIDRGGGLAAARDARLLRDVAMPIAGILSSHSVESMARQLTDFSATLRGMGLDYADPLLPLFLMALAVSPELKITDKGLVDVVHKHILDLVITERSDS